MTVQEDINRRVIKLKNVKAIFATICVIKKISILLLVSIGVAILAFLSFIAYLVIREECALIKLRHEMPKKIIAVEKVEITERSRLPNTEGIISDNTTIYILQSGEEAEVIDIKRNTEGMQFYKVRVKSGEEGFVPRYKPGYKYIEVE